jgi:flagellar brake protein
MARALAAAPSSQRQQQSIPRLQRTDFGGAGPRDMLFLTTQPSALENPGDLATWMKFRVPDARVRLAALRELVRGDTPLVVGAPGYPAFNATLWSVDDALGRVQLNVDSEGTNLRAALAAPLLWAAGYVDVVKVQFPLLDPVLQQQGGRIALSAALPADLYRMPRRRAVRVRRELKHAPRMRLDGNPRSGLGELAGSGLPRPARDRELVVLDISTTGCALFFPPDRPAPAEGTILRKVEVRLDDEHFLFTDIVVHNLQRAARGSHRVGCSWKGMPPGCEETLRRWLQRGQSSLARLSLSFD